MDIKYRMLTYSKPVKVLGYLYAKSNSQAVSKANYWVSVPFLLQRKDNRGKWITVYDPGKR